MGGIIIEKNQTHCAGEGVRECSKINNTFAAFAYTAAPVPSDRDFREFAFLISVDVYTFRIGSG